MRRIATVLAAVVVVFLTGCSSSNGDDSTAVTTASSSPATNRTPTEAPATPTTTPSTVMTASPTATPAPTAVSPQIGIEVEFAGSIYVVNELRDPAPAGIFEPDPGNRLVAIDVTQIATAAEDPFNPLYFAVQDRDAFVYTSGFVDVALEPSLASGDLTEGQMVRGWVAFEVPTTAVIESILAQGSPLGRQQEIANVTASTALAVRSSREFTPPTGSPNLSETSQNGGSRYTINEVRDPAPIGFLGIGEGNRLIAIDVTQEGTSQLDPFNPLYFALQDAAGYIYFPGFTDSALAPSLSSGDLGAGQKVRGWVAFEVPENAEIRAVLTQPHPLGGTVVIAALD